MNGLIRFRRRRVMPYCLGLGFAMGLGHEKREWRIVLQTFTGEQWVQNFRMTSR